MDATNTDNTGIQIDCGITASSPSAITVGTDKGGFIEATFFTTDWTKHDGVVIGFRKIEAFQTGFGGVVAAATGDPVYQDVAVFGMMGTSDKLQTMTDLNNSGSATVTDTGNVAVDSQNLKLRVTVSSTGAVTYLYEVNGLATSTNLSAPTSTVSYTFDDGDIIIPFVTIQNVNNNNAIYLKQLKICKI